MTYTTAVKESLTSGKLTKTDKFFYQIRQRSYWKTHEVIQLGLSLYLNGGDRLCRRYAEQGRVLTRFTASELKTLNYEGKEEIWFVNGKKEQAERELRV